MCSYELCWKQQRTLAIHFCLRSTADCTATTARLFHSSNALVQSQSAVIYFISLAMYLIFSVVRRSRNEARSVITWFNLGFHKACCVKDCVDNTEISCFCYKKDFWGATVSSLFVDATSSSRPVQCLICVTALWYIVQYHCACALAILDVVGVQGFVQTSNSSFFELTRARYRCTRRVMFNF